MDLPSKPNSPHLNQYTLTNPNTPLDYTALQFSWLMDTQSLNHWSRQVHWVLTPKASSIVYLQQSYHIHEALWLSHILLFWLHISKECMLRSWVQIQLFSLHTGTSPTDLIRKCIVQLGLWWFDSMRRKDQFVHNFFNINRCTGAGTLHSLVLRL